MNTITYRLATADDVPALASLRDASGWTGGAGAETMRRYLAGAHHPQHALPPRAAIVAEADEAVVGYVAGHRTTRFGCAGELQWLLVAPAYRGGEVAAGLLAAMAAWFLAQGAARVCVDVAPENVVARRLYARHGAEPLSEYWMVWPDISAARQPSRAPAG
jgi:predicted GNAT family acetyltransferase